ncbi:MAG TPA: hypothetical protein VGC64_12265, partial [Pyrinomonadaceae bacterium]
MRHFNHTARILLLALLVAVACGIFSPQLKAQETTKSSRQRLRRVGSEPSQPASPATLQQTNSS